MKYKKGDVLIQEWERPSGEVNSVVWVVETVRTTLSVRQVWVSAGDGRRVTRGWYSEASCDEFKLIRTDLEKLLYGLKTS